MFNNNKRKTTHEVTQEDDYSSDTSPSNTDGGDSQTEGEATSDVSGAEYDLTKKLLQYKRPVSSSITHHHPKELTSSKYANVTSGRKRGIEKIRRKRGDARNIVTQHMSKRRHRDLASGIKEVGEEDSLKSADDMRVLQLGTEQAIIPRIALRFWRQGAVLVFDPAILFVFVNPTASRPSTLTTVITDNTGPVYVADSSPDPILASSAHILYKLVFKLFNSYIAYTNDDQLAKFYNTFFLCAGDGSEDRSPRDGRVIVEKSYRLLAMKNLRRTLYPNSSRYDLYIHIGLGCLSTCSPSDFDIDVDALAAARIIDNTKCEVDPVALVNNIFNLWDHYTKDDLLL